MVRRHSVWMALGLFIILGTASAFARDLVSLRAKIPFSFKVGEATLPAGEYALRFDGAELPGVLRIYSQDGRGGALIQTLKADIPADAGERPTLVFEKAGDEHVLAQVFDPGNYGLQVLNPRAHLERERVAVLAH